MEMNEFYVGTDDLKRCGELTHCMISATTLAKRKAPFAPQKWILDSGAFSQISRFGDFIMDEEPRHFTRRSATNPNN